MLNSFYPFHKQSRQKCTWLMPNRLENWNREFHLFSVCLLVWHTIQVAAVPVFCNICMKFPVGKLSITCPSSSPRKKKKRALMQFLCEGKPVVPSRSLRPWFGLCWLGPWLALWTIKTKQLKHVNPFKTVWLTFHSVCWKIRCKSVFCLLLICVHKSYS